jgi:hypothetical protein
MRFTMAHKSARERARRLPPDAFPAWISVSSSLLAATMIQKSSYLKNRALSQWCWRRTADAGHSYRAAKGEEVMAA